MTPLRLWEASPAWDFVDEVLVGFDLSFTLLFTLKGLDGASLDPEELQAISQKLQGLIDALPENYLLRLYQIELSGYGEELTDYISQFEERSLGHYMAQKRAKVCSENLYHFRGELLLTLSSPAQFEVSSPASLLLGPTYPTKVVGRSARRMTQTCQKVCAQSIYQLRLAGSLLAGQLQGVGVSAKALGRQEAYGALWRLANPAKCGAFEAPVLREGMSLRSQLFHSGIVNRQDYFERDGQFYRVLSLKLLPKAVVPGQLQALTRFPFQSVSALSLKKLPKAKATAQIERARNAGFQFGSAAGRYRSAEANRDKPDFSLGLINQDANSVLSHLADGEEACEVAIQLLVSGTTREGLDRNTEQALERFSRMGQAEAGIEEFRGRTAYLSMLPGHQSLMGDRFHFLLSGAASDLMPVFQEERGPSSPSCLLNGKSGALLGFDPFDPRLEAWNAIVSAGSGKGKSFATRLLLSGFLAKGGRMIVATLGKDYNRYIKLFSGRVIEVRPDNDALCLGPFPSPRLFLDKARRPLFLQHLVAILEVLATENSKSLPRKSRALLYRAADRLYAGLDPDADAPRLDDFIKELVKEEGPESSGGLVDALRFWLEGPFGEALLRNQEKDSAGCVWNLQYVEDAETREVMLAVMAGQVSESLEAGKTLILLDEVWKLFKTPSGAALVETLYRTVRKEGGAIWTITQSVNDYLGLPDSARSAILNNSPVKILLEHDPSDVEQVVRLFELNQAQAGLLRSLESRVGEFSDLFLMLGPRRQVARLCPSAIEYWLATSHKDDLGAFEIFQLAYPESTDFEILRRLGRRFEHGAIGCSPREIKIQLRLDAAA